jgi:hypothetical protein
MICPSCRAEYREGFTRCHDCDVPLVSSLEEAEAGVAVFTGDDALVPFHTTRHPDLLGALLEGLEDERIPYAIQAGTALCMLDGQELPQAGEPDFWEARILVLASKVPQAATLLHRLQAS